jgi:hypothetical protein
MADTWISPDYPNTNFGTLDAAHLQGSYTPDRLLFLPNLAALPPGANVQKATLQVYAYSATSGSNTLGAYQVLTPWSSGAATYQSPWHQAGLQPGVDVTTNPVGSATVAGTGWMSVDVTAAVRAWQVGAANDGLMVRLTAGAGYSHYRVYMAESGRLSNRPKLTIIYTGG